MADMIARAIATQAKALAVGTTNGETVDARTGADGSARATLGALVREIHQNVLNNNTNLSDAAKQSQVLTHGLSVINGSLDSPVDVEVQGRTLVSLGSSTLDNTKNYVLADKKTRLKWADASTVQGVAKFAGKSEKPALVRVANFEGKVSGSTVENPHIVKRNAGVSLFSPSGFTTEYTQVDIDKLKSLDSTLCAIGNPTSGNMSQQLFSFDIIQEIERQIGRIPKATLADKVQWCKDNINTFICNWDGYGSGPNGNKATFLVWNGFNWAGTANHTNGTVTQIQRNDTPNYLMSDGFMYYLAYADPSDGVTASTINTDYVELVIELKPTAILHDPVVPLYQIDDTTEYNNILTTWPEADVLNRYPKVQGVQHLQNVYAMAEGENLLPPFSEWNLHANAVVTAPYNLSLNATGVLQRSVYLVKGVAGQTYTFTGDNYTIEEYSADGNTFVKTIAGFTGISQTFTFTFNPTTVGNVIRISTYNAAAGTFTFTNPMLTVGSTAKPFTPRNPSYLFATAKLGQIGTVKDVLYKNDGQWYVRKSVEKDVVLDGSLAWVGLGDANIGFKSVYVDRTGFVGIPSSGTISSIITKFDGKILKNYGATGANDIDVYNNSGSGLNLQFTVSDYDTGFGETYSPITTEWKAYFYGWQAKTVDANGKPTAWRSLGDGTDAPTQTLAYVSVTKAPNFTPYKLSYVLATPVVQPAVVEGDLALNGPTQIEVGSGVIVREKVVPFKNGTIEYWINNGTANLSKKLDKFIGIYKNGISDISKWSIRSDNNPNGKYRAVAAVVDIDTTAEYTVTYLVFSVDNTRAAFTNNTTEFTTKYDSSLKSVVDNLVEKQSDLMTVSSVNVQAIAELYKRVKALGG